MVNFCIFCLTFFEALLENALLGLIKPTALLNQKKMVCSLMNTLLSEISQQNPSDNPSMDNLVYHLLQIEKTAQEHSTSKLRTIMHMLW